MTSITNRCVKPCCTSRSTSSWSAWDSHKTLYEHLEALLYRPSCANGREKTEETYTYRYLNQVPTTTICLLRCELTVTRADGKQLYKNAFATDHWITDQTVEAIVQSGRTRWKVENEQCTLKTKGYNLEHNFGHGKQHLASLLATFNLLSLLFHTLLELLDDKYRC